MSCSTCWLIEGPRQEGIQYEAVSKRHHPPNIFPSSYELSSCSVIFTIKHKAQHDYTLDMYIYSELCDPRDSAILHSPFSPDKIPKGFPFRSTFSSKLGHDSSSSSSSRSELKELKQTGALESRRARNVVVQGASREAFSPDARYFSGDCFFKRTS